MELISSLLPFLKPLLDLAVEKYGAIAVVIAYLLFVVAPIVTVLIEAAEALVILSASNKDDQAVARVKAVWTGKVLPILELLPHVNLPVAPFAAQLVIYIRKGANAAKAAIQAWRQG